MPLLNSIRTLLCLYATLIFRCNAFFCSRPYLSTFASNNLPRLSLVQGPSLETKPDYDEIHGPLGPEMDKLFLCTFRSKMAENIGNQYDSTLPYGDYSGLMELARTMNIVYDKPQVKELSQNILRSLFPSWLPNAFGWMFARPFPAFSAKMNAWATYVVGTWLMGECEINDCRIDGDDENQKSGLSQGLLVKRCRFLEESGCASVCVNSCKLPTQQFFLEDMGLPLTMKPDYDTYECQFSFGLSPTADDEDEAKNTPCLARCPSRKVIKKQRNVQPIDREKCFAMDK
mmetsp:Transcript_14712/g.27682  ORF Transcript_14712/g.27682 Transcript_14712/m.27682 type:complete len:287 (+) Transcript_14712:54-914(+)